jgi:ribosomal protein S27AE
MNDLCSQIDEDEDEDEQFDASEECHTLVDIDEEIADDLAREECPHCGGFGLASEPNDPCPRCGAVGWYE